MPGNSNSPKLTIHTSSEDKDKPASASSPAHPTAAIQAAGEPSVEAAVKPEESADDAPDDGSIETEAQSAKQLPPYQPAGISSELWIFNFGVAMVLWAYKRQVDAVKKEGIVDNKGLVHTAEKMLSAGLFWSTVGALKATGEYLMGKDNPPGEPLTEARLKELINADPKKAVNITKKQLEIAKQKLELAETQLAQAKDTDPDYGQKKAEYDAAQQHHEQATKQYEAAEKAEKAQKQQKATNNAKNLSNISSGAYNKVRSSLGAAFNKTAAAFGELTDTASEAVASAKNAAGQLSARAQQAIKPPLTFTDIRPPQSFAEMSQNNPNAQTNPRPTTTAPRPVSK